MGFNELSRFEKMEDPDPREAQDLIRKGKKPKATYKRSSTGKTVSLKTARRTSAFITLAIWLSFLAGVAFVIYIVMGAYVS